jgi:energy-coupling factor transporter ATP-binding protein EcfA2
MITGLGIKNFRGLRDVSLDGLARVNVIVGDNGSGKTALLEAIHVAASGSPQAAINLASWRGLDYSQSPQIGAHAANPWTYLFRATGAFSPIEIELKRDGARVCAVRISRAIQHLVGLSRVGVGLLPTQAWQSVIWEVAQGSADQWTVVGVPTSQDTLAPILPALPTFFLAASLGGSEWLAQSFSDLARSGRVANFVGAMREQFPNISNVEIQLDAGRPRLHIQLADTLTVLPMNVVSDGMVKLSGLLLSIASTEGGVTLIDEIENGLHHSRLRLLWQQVRDFAERFDTQVFATTHSLECLDGAAAAMTEHPDDFAFVRMTRFHGDCVARLLPGDRAGRLLRSSLEVRG